MCGRRPARSIHNNSGGVPGAARPPPPLEIPSPAFLSYANVQPNKEETMCRNEEEAESERHGEEGRGQGWQLVSQWASSLGRPLGLPVVVVVT